MGEASEIEMENYFMSDYEIDEYDKCDHCGAYLDYNGHCDICDDEELI